MSMLCKLESTINSTIEDLESFLSRYEHNVNASNTGDCELLEEHVELLSFDAIVSECDALLNENEDVTMKKESCVSYGLILVDLDHMVMDYAHDDDAVDDYDADVESIIEEDEEATLYKEVDWIGSVSECGDDPECEYDEFEDGDEQEFDYDDCDEMEEENQEHEWMDGRKASWSSAASTTSSEPQDMTVYGHYGVNEWRMMHACGLEASMDHQWGPDGEPLMISV